MSIRFTSFELHPHKESIPIIGLSGEMTIIRNQLNPFFAKLEGQVEDRQTEIPCEFGVFSTPGSHLSGSQTSPIEPVSLAPKNLWLFVVCQVGMPQTMNLITISWFMTISVLHSFQDDPCIYNHMALL